LRNQVKILDWITKVAQDDGLTVILTTHHPEHAIAISDRTVLMMGPSRARVVDTATEMSEQLLEELYHVPIKTVEYVHGAMPQKTVVPVLPSRSRRSLPAS